MSSWPLSRPWTDVFGSRRPHRQESTRHDAAAVLYERFRTSEAPRSPSLEDVAMEAIVTGVVERTDSGTSLGVPLTPLPVSARAVPLTEAIALLEPVLDRRVKQPRTAALAARCLHALFRETGAVPPLRRAAELAQWAVTAGDDRPGTRRELVEMLLDLAHHEDHHANLACAGRLALDLDVRTRGRVMTAMFEATGDDVYRRDALRQATDGIVGDDHDPADVHALGEALRASYEATGSINDLENAVVALRDAADREASAEHLLGLARVLLLLYPKNGDDRTLREATGAARRALAAARPADPRRFRYLQTAAQARMLSHAARPGGGVVDVAVELQRLAVGAMAVDHPGRSAAIGLLADLWTARYEHGHRHADLDGALDAVAEGRRLSAGQPDHHRHLARFGRLSRYVFELDDDPIHLLRGVKVTGEAANTEGLSEVVRGSYLLQIAQLGLLAERRNPSEDKAEHIRSLLFTVFRIDGQDPRVVAETGRLWTELAIAAESWTEASLACFSTMRAMSRMTGIEVSRESQESTLAGFSGLAALGAACELQAGDPESALLMLELGRGVMLTQDLGLYWHAQALRRDAPDLGRRLTEFLRTRDEAATRLDRGGGLLSHGQISDQRRIAARNLQILGAEVRDTPGHHRFLTIPEKPDLLAAAGDGPIVVVNVSPLRSDALVVQPDGVTVIPLPALTPTAVDDLTGRFTAAAADSDPAAGETMLDCLEWLWNHLAEPVLAIAAPLGSAPARIWWCPTGRLSRLPLHAAGHHRGDDGLTVLARAISSYIPTITTLDRVRARRPVPVPDPGLLAVAVSTSGSSEDDLPGARREAAAVAAAHPRTTILTDEAVTRQSLAGALPGHRRAHLMCHAVADPERPSLSRLALHGKGETLTVRDIARLDLSEVELAYLSMCDAAVSGASIPDESVHIAGAFLIAGYPDVIGTLWPMPDVVGGLAAQTFYRHLTAGQGPAEALHHTVAELHEVARESPVVWANLIHFGG